MSETMTPPPVVYSVDATKSLLSDLLYRCEAEQRRVPPVLITLTRAEATAKQLDDGAAVWIKPVRGASQIAVGSTDKIGAIEPVSELAG